MGKINNIRNRSIDNTNVIIRQVSSNKSLSDKVTNANLSSYNTQVIHNLNTEWYDLDLELDDEGVGSLQTQFISFETIFEKFDERLIPYISTVLVYRQEGGADDSQMLPLSQSSNFFEIEDIFGSALKKVRVTTTFYIADMLSVNVPHKAQLVVSIYNPSNFWRID